MTKNQKLLIGVAVIGALWYMSRQSSAANMGAGFPGGALNPNPYGGLLNPQGFQGYGSPAALLQNFLPGNFGSPQYAGGGSPTIG